MLRSEASGRDARGSRGDDAKVRLADRQVRRPNPDCDSDGNADPGAHSGAFANACADTFANPNSRADRDAGSGESG